MKRFLLFTVLLAVLVTLAPAAQPKPLADVDLTALNAECQHVINSKFANGQQSVNLVWVVPLEYWQATLQQNPQVTRQQIDQIAADLKGIVIIAVVRGQVSQAGQFTFLDQDTVQKNISVRYTGADGKTVTLDEQKEVSQGAAAILGTMKPILRAAMGQLGQNFAFFVYKDLSPDGKRLVPITIPGKLDITLAPLANEPGGTHGFAFPLNSLFVPRTCSKCKQGNMDVHWHFCPNCGTKLPD